MQRRLHYAGMRPINNVVDVTNYVMLEWGQPLHAFDYDVLVKRAGGKPPTIIVRPARAGEKLKTLDGQERELTPDNLVIADTAGPIALAGVMGGLETEVTDGDEERSCSKSASFDFVSVRRTARQFDLFSEASTRFSRGVHPEVVEPGRDAGGATVRTSTPAARCWPGMVDNYPAPVAAAGDRAERAPRSRRLLGVDDARRRGRARADGACSSRSSRRSGGWKVTTPPTRLDIQAGAADLIEELARVYGYDRLPETLLAAASCRSRRGNRSLDLEERVRDLLADAGLAGGHHLRADGAGDARRS